LENIKKVKNWQAGNIEEQVGIKFGGRSKWLRPPRLLKSSGLQN